MDIGARIKFFRKAKNLSTRDLAKLTNISQPVISRLENNTRTADIDLISRICDALGVTLAQFFADDSFPPELNHLLAEAKDLTPEQVEALTEFIRRMKRGD